MNLCDTGQHQDLLPPLYDLFCIRPDIQLQVLKKGQSLDKLIANLHNQLPAVLDRVAPDLVVVQGDTASAFSAAMAACTRNIPVAHVEAGLRTYDLKSPFPEEIYRQAISKVSTWHFCPTESNRQNLLREDIPAGRIFVTGNTSVDMVLKSYATRKNQAPPPIPGRDMAKPYLLATLHRRESQGAPLRQILATLLEFATATPAYDLIITLHPNPVTSALIHERLGHQANIFLIEALDYHAFVQLMAGAFAIITDSGGIQEEAPALNVPVIVVRDRTERQEGVENGCLRLAGTARRPLLQELDLLIHDIIHYKGMQAAKNPFGDGLAAERIAHHLIDIAESTS